MPGSTANAPPADAPLLSSRASDNEITLSPHVEASHNYATSHSWVPRQLIAELQDIVEALSPELSSAETCGQPSVRI